MDLKQSKILITGGKGMLAIDLGILFSQKGISYTSIDVDELDITNDEAVKNYFENFKPSLLINCAAYTAVDKCETEPLAKSINGQGPGILAKYCKVHNAKLIHFSTDYIFSGNFTSPIPEDNMPHPINKYGEGKLLGENNILNVIGLNYLILRVQWLYGKNGKNFIDTIINLSKTKSELNVVSDQIGRPTSTPFLSELILECLEKDLSGIYHAGPKDFCSWYDLAVFITSGSSCKINPIPSSAYPTPAKRPLYSVLSIEKITKALSGSSLLKKTWKELASEYLKSKDIL